MVGSSVWQKPSSLPSHLHGPSLSLSPCPWFVPITSRARSFSSGCGFLLKPLLYESGVEALSAGILIPNVSLCEMVAYRVERLRYLFKCIVIWPIWEFAGPLELRGVVSCWQFNFGAVCWKSLVFAFLLQLSPHILLLPVHPPLLLMGMSCHCCQRCCPWVLALLSQLFCLCLWRVIWGDSITVLGTHCYLSPRGDG